MIVLIKEKQSKIFVVCNVCTCNQLFLKKKNCQMAMENTLLVLITISEEINYQQILTYNC